MEQSFFDKNGKLMVGKVARIYKSFEGTMRYIIICDGKEYRCEKNGKYLEEVVI